MQYFYRYATKYCHSLKLHLRKYGHKPAMVLNNDGSPNPLPAMDMFGGKRPKGRKEESMYPPTMLPQFPSLPPNLMQLQLQHLQNQFGGHHKLAPGAPFRLDEPGKYAHKIGDASNGNHSPTYLGEEQMHCDKCEFATTSKDVFRNHLMLHASTERGALHQLLTSPLQHGKRTFSEHNKSGEDLSFSPRMRSSSPSSPSSPFGLRHPFDKSDSPTSSASPSSFPPHMSYFNKLAMSNQLLQGLVPNPAIRALMEERHRESLRMTPPDSLRETPDSAHTREGAPLPPNKRHKADIFSALYASRMSEVSEKAESPPGALDLSKETVVGGGSHGSSSDVDTGSNPRSHASSPALSGSVKSRRKGKAFKIERRSDRDSEEDTPMPSLVPIRPAPGADPAFTGNTACKFCGIAFQSSVMFRLHMEYHGFEDPFKCSHCGEEAADAVAFFLHIARREHQ